MPPKHELSLHDQLLYRHAEQYIADEIQYPELSIPIEQVRVVVFAFLENMRHREMREACEDLAKQWPQALEQGKKKYPTRAERHEFGEPTKGDLFDA